MSIRILLFAALFGAVSCQKKGEQKFDRFPEGKKKANITVEGLTVPDADMEVGLFAAEPQLFNPTNMDIDHRGRVWLCEAYNYRTDVNHISYDKKGDKILILEDTDGDGKADKSKVFYQGEDVNAALGICVLGNKVIVSASPNVFLFTDEDGDDIPEKKEILFKTTGGLQNDHGVHAMVFGPDGYLYFSFGNYGGGLTDASGTPIKDIYGREIGQTRKPFQDGMAVRCDVEFKNFEVLGWNFRNNYELTLDSYGRIWQSDNDDDGVRSNRINAVLPHGNYGYKDEVTGADWRAYRTNKEDSVWKQHWHQNDPGVVPNLKVLGAGSPTGTFIYEGEYLPERYRGAMLLGDAVNNDISAYHLRNEKAGYRAERTKILDASKKDQWFRPSDVAAGPDGSVFVADWYDVGVGGHFVGDLEKGRIYRVFPKGRPQYKVPEYDYTQVGSLVEALQNPNNAVRYLAYSALKKKGKEAEGALYALAKGQNTRYSARALWLLKNIDAKYLEEFAAHPDEDLRAAVVRMSSPTSPLMNRLAKDPSFQVKQAVATKLYRTKNTEAWVDLALAYTSGDRWYLEALGIGASDFWDEYLDAFLQEKSSGPEVNDIVWRSRAKKTSALLAGLIHQGTHENSLRYFRALDFQDTAIRNEALLNLLKITSQEERKLLIFKHFDTESILGNPEFQKVIPSILAGIKNDKDFLDIVLKYRLKEQKDRVLAILDTSADPVVYRQAAEVANLLFGVGILKEAITRKPLDVDFAVKRIARVGLVDHEVVTRQLIQVFTSKKYPFEVRETAVLAMEGYISDVRLWELMKVNKISKELLPAAKEVMRKTFHNDIKVEFEHLYGTPESQEIVPMPDFSKGKGEAALGLSSFAKHCSVCHSNGTIGGDFGPGLSEIGKKLTEEALYKAIVYPNQGISLGYETSQISFKDGSSLQAIVTSKTATHYLVKVVGELEVKEFSVESIKNVTRVDGVSLMPSFPLGQKEMLDLVAYLKGLKGE